MPYDHQNIEKKWQKFWQENKIFQTQTPPHPLTPSPSEKGDGTGSSLSFRRGLGGTGKKYILDMFPYPSGAGLHVGHPKGYTATDIVSRYYHAKGYNVLHPMGFDAFGLPAENYAIKTGTHPAITTAENIATFTEQMKNLGFSYDWDRMVDTTDPEYYKWTQWIFLKLFERGLAYEQDLPINYCPSCKTGLANEEVLSDNTCDRCGTRVERRPIRQWVLKITEYAERLIEDLDGLDWPEGIKEMQRNWIGKSEGCEFRMMKDEGFVYSQSSKEDFEKILEIREKTAPHALNLTNEGFFVVKQGENIAGFIRVNYFGDFVELGPLYIEEKYRGKKLGHKLISYVIENTIAEEFYIDCKNELANYYEKFGFKYLTKPKTFQMEKLHKVWGFYKKDFSEKDILEATTFMSIRKKDFISQIPSIRVYTTRVDTVYGMTYAVLAPDHPQVSDFITPEQRIVCEAYIEEAKSKSDQDRTADNKEKTGVWTGSYVINPYNGESVPLWIADYVLGHYGTGAVMAVPAHDERDGEFARKYNLPIKQSIAKVAIHTGNSAMREGVETLNRQVIDVILENQKGEFLLIEENDPQDFHFIGGGIEDGDDELITVKKEILEESGYCDIEIMGEIVGSYIYSEGFRHTKQKNQKTGGRFYHVKLTSENRVHSEIETGHHKMVWLSKDEIANTITWEAHLHAWNLFLGKIQPTTEDGTLVDSNEFSGLSSADARRVLTEKAETEGFGIKKVNYKLRDWLFSRQRYWGEPIPLIHISYEDYAKLPRIENIEDAEVGIASVIARNEAIQLPETLDRHASLYSARDDGPKESLVIDGQIFSDIYDGINGKIIIDHRLPLTLPEVERYEPAGDGQSPLATVPTFVNVKLAENLSGKRETNTMPQWGGSCWYYLRYMDNKNSDALASQNALDYWGTVDEYVGGAEHAVLHLLYARFWHKVLYDAGVVPTKEPFQKLTNVGMILAYAYEHADGGLVAVDLVEERDGRFFEKETGKEVKQVVAKMSKSLKNVVNPNDIVREYGADTLRLYEMNMAGFTDTAPWNPEAITGVRRFLDKAYVTCVDGKNIAKDDMKAMKLLHKTIKKVGEDIVGYKFNTAISSLMILLNEGVPSDAEFATEWKEKFAILLHPFAPHMAEELYNLIPHPSPKGEGDGTDSSSLEERGQGGEVVSIYNAPWPDYDEFMLVDDEVTIAVQVNGKLRGTLTCFNGVAQEEVSLLAHEQPEIAKWLEGKTLVKEIFIPNKMLSIVVKD